MHSDRDDVNAGVSAIYMQTNELDGNRMLGFDTDPTGTLISGAEFQTGGAGDGVPHLASQGSVVLSDDGQHLLVTNAGSGDVSDFGMGPSGMRLMQTAPTGGAPKSVAEHDGLIYVLNTDTPSLSGFHIDSDRMQMLPDSTRMLQSDADPAQVGFSPDGDTLLITERGANAIASYPVRADGQLGEPHLSPSSGPTPYGFAFTPQGALLVTEAFGAQKGMAAASSYITHGGDLTPTSRSVGSGRSEVCWAVVSNDGHYLFTTNFGDGAVTRYAIGADGSLTLDDAAAATTIEGQAGLRDESMSRDGRFLYAIHSDSHRLYGWSLGSAGALTPIGSWEGLPETVAGLAVS